MKKSHLFFKTLILTISIFTFFYLLRIFVFSLYKIPTSSMENTILIGDYILGAQIHSKDGKFKFFENFFTKPQRDEIVIFKHPIIKYPLIKRVVAISGDTISYRNKKLFINSKYVELPINGKNIDNKNLIFRDNSPSLYILPKKGDIIKIDSTNLMLFEYSYYMYLQQFPNKKVKIKRYLYIDNKRIENYNNIIKKSYNLELKKITDCDWVDNYTDINYIREIYPNKEIYFVEKLYDENNNVINEFKLDDDLFFVMGDNRDFSNDSRFFGPILYKNILTKPLIIYFSIDKNIQGNILKKIRFNRIGNFIN